LDLTNDIDAASQLLERIDSKQLELKKFKEDLRNFEDAILKKENNYSTNWAFQENVQWFCIKILIQINI